MAIWEFTDYTTKELTDMLKRYEQDEDERDEDMMRELRSEIGKREEENGYIITFVAINNDTYESNIFTLHYSVTPDDDESEKDIVFKELPKNIINEVKSTYDGVWEPELDTIEVFKVEKIKNWTKFDLKQLKL